MLNEKTTFTLSLGKIITALIAVIGFAFTIGMTYQQVLPARELQKKQAEEIADIKITMARVVTVLENMEKRDAAKTRDIASLQSRAATMNVQLELISSKLEDQKERKKRY